MNNELIYKNTLIDFINNMPVIIEDTISEQYAVDILTFTGWLKHHDEEIIKKTKAEIKGE